MRIATPVTETPVNPTAQTAENKEVSKEKTVTVTIPAQYEYVIVFNDGSTKVHTVTERLPVAQIRKNLKKADDTISDVFFRGQQTSKVEIPFSVIKPFLNK